MFASLDSFDTVLPPVDGRARYVQTDGRTSEEIAREPHLSTLFAVTRVRNPIRFADPSAPPPIVRYAAMNAVPFYVHEAIIAAGGELGTREGVTVPYNDRPRSLETILDEAVRGLVADVSKTFGVGVDRDGLVKLESHMLGAKVPTAKDDAFAHWRAVFQLGALAGEVIRAKVGGKWSITAQKAGPIPIVLRATMRGEEKQIGPFGKAHKMLSTGAVPASATASSSDALPTVVALVDVVTAR